jgi:hypothetical protein
MKYFYKNKSKNLLKNIKYLEKLYSIFKFKFFLFFSGSFDILSLENNDFK